jgi:hypothetical protein
MVGLSHVILHVGLCSSAGRATPDTTIAMHVRAINRIGKSQMDKAFRFERGGETPPVVSFDLPPGTYRLDMALPKYDCSASDFVQLLRDHDRSISENLNQGVQPPPTPMLLEGTAPTSFLYAKPTFVLFDKNTTCDKPVGDPIQARIDVENDQDAYYASLYPDASMAARGPLVVALQLGTATGEDHYIRVPMQFPAPWNGWPENVRFNVTEDELDELAGKPVDTLLCPHLLKTTSG